MPTIMCTINAVSRFDYARARQLKLILANGRRSRLPLTSSKKLGGGAIGRSWCTWWRYFNGPNYFDRKTMKTAPLGRKITAAAATPGPDRPAAHHRKDATFCRIDLEKKSENTTTAGNEISWKLINHLRSGSTKRRAMAEKTRVR